MWEEGESVNHESSSTDADWILVMITPPFWQLSLVFFSWSSNYYNSSDGSVVVVVPPSKLSSFRKSHTCYSHYTPQTNGAAAVLSDVVSPSSFSSPKNVHKLNAKRTFLKFVGLFIIRWLSWFSHLLSDLCIHLYFCAHKKCIHFESLPTLSLKPCDLRMRGYLKVVTVYCAAIGR